jgi:hypothetical protein
LVCGYNPTTIITLRLAFVDCFSLPSQTIKAIGRIPNLCNLRLDCDSNDWDITIKADPACLKSLLMEAQGLKYLRLGVPALLPDMMAGASYPAINHLKVDTICLSPDALLSISTALKPIIKLLSIRDSCADHNEFVQPVYKMLRDTL